MRLIWFIGAAALVASGAAGADGISDAELKEARKLYIAKCAKCHKLYDPAKYEDAEWSKWMTKMTKKAKLKPAQAELLARYLETFRKPVGTSLGAKGAGMALPRIGGQRWGDA